MFGCIAAGRPVQTNLVQVDSSKYVFELTNAESINHLVIFLAGQQFPQGYGATVHFLWPQQQNPQWSFLGVLTNEKPSAIFKLSGQKSLNKSTDMLLDEDPAFVATTSAVAQLGISIEPIQSVLSQQEMSSRRSSSQLVLKSSTNPHVLIAVKLLQGFYNYCCSFATSLPMNANLLFNMQENSQMGNTFIPVKVLQDWYKTTLHKIENDQSLFKDMDIQ